jgi:hypothetical protein
MISNERPSPYNRWTHSSSSPSSSWSNYQPKPHVNEDTLKSGHLQIERKAFAFALKENLRGRLLRITEEIGGRRNSIIIPATGLVEFRNMLEEMIKASETLPPASAPKE